MVSFRHTQSDNTTDSPSPRSMFSFFPKFMSNSYKYADFYPQWNQNLKPNLIGLFFTYWHIRILPLNLHVCSSIDWWDSGCIASWKCFNEWSKRGRSFHARSYCSRFLGAGFCRLSAKCMFWNISQNSHQNIYP